MLPRFVPPAGTALYLGDIATWLRGAVHPAPQLEALAAAFRSRYGLRHVFFVSSGRAGMSVLLRVLAERTPGRDEVLMPGYTCYSVAASAIRAGLKVRPLDVEPGTLGFAPHALAEAPVERALALTSGNLYGIPDDLPGLERFTRERGIAFVDDAAQCLDGRVGERWAGTFGDAGLFSFDKGKNITTLQGGVVVCQDDALAERLNHAFSAFAAPGAGRVAAEAASLLLYSVLLRPRLYWLPERVLTLGETPFDLEYPTTRYSTFMAPLARRLLGRIDGITAGRVRNAGALRDRLRGTPGVVVPENPGARSVFPRFPLVFEEPTRRNAVLAELRRAGIGATGSYPGVIGDIPQARPHLAPSCADTPGARRVAAGMLTLPTHPFVTPRDIERMSGVVRGSSSRVNPA